MMGDGGIEKYVPFETLLGKTIRSIRGGKDSDQLTFITTENEEYRMEHEQDCCESVAIEDIAGDLQDLIGLPLLQAEEVSNAADNPRDESGTFTFYKLGTNKGRVTIRWYGESNGYYSEGVSFGLVQKTG